MREKTPMMVATDTAHGGSDMNLTEVLDRLETLALGAGSGRLPPPPDLADLATGFASLKDRLAVTDPQLWSTLVFFGFFGLRFADWPSRPSGELPVAALEIRAAVAEVRTFLASTQ